VITGVAEGSTTITLNAAAVAGEYTAASTTINVTVTKPYVPAIVIDGDFTDWTTDIKEGVTIYSFENDNGTGHSSTDRLPRWKATSDERNIYLYYEIGSGKLLTGKNIITGLDLGADGEGGSSAGGNIGGSCEVEIAFAPLTDNSGTTECVEGEVGSINYNGSTVGQVYLSGTISGNAYIEISIPRDKIGSPSSELTINACHSFDWYTTGWHTFNLK
ncbi:MAG: hypothetical protein IJR25_08615, partial [Bacteroidales bacterium]|nr:hypothetical protein [Bacteroidales bacterium]